ncbi:hypothetical protein [Candidatus Mycoplasma mahonii]|uniref:hypothetical protein n=1 Tax=Candidatus Mycoplasma mahonii TaxID=3004105 RepID=UPI0026EAEDCB|nr:hypothetical protein [Candidatus Mycoplasma mahonii]WKX02278.1 hypothetical protein O3I44_02640 [Candidatus Mycoplasma mahonii]
MLMDVAKKEASGLSGIQIGEELLPRSLQTIIFSKITKAFYEPPRSIFSFVSGLFINILMGHKLTDGNKRVSLLFLILSLRYFGYHFSWSKGIHQNYTFYETKIEKIVKDLEKGYNEKDEINIEKWVKKYSTIALYWR